LTSCAFLIAEFTDGIEHLPGIPGALKAPVEKEMALVGLYVIQNESCMGDYKTRFDPKSAEVLLEEFLDDLAEKGDVLQVDARLRLVEEDEVGILGHELDQFRFFDLPSREAVIYFPVEKFGEFQAFCVLRRLSAVASLLPQKVHQVSRFESLIVGGRWKAMPIPRFALSLIGRWVMSRPLKVILPFVIR